MNGSIFLKLEFPTPALCFYIALLLAVALFFKFTRLLSMRNLDVVTLFAAMPGLLLLVETEGHSWWGYLWLLCGNGYFLVRCLFDLILVRRPALSPNLNIGGLMWLAGALLIGLIAAPPNTKAGPPNGTSAPPVDAVPKGVQKISEISVPVLVVERGLTVLCHVSIVVGLMLIGWRHFNDFHIGVAAATFYLLLPYAYFLMPWALLGAGRWDHALAMAFMVWSVFTYRRPLLAGAFLGAAAGCVFFPIWTLPVWLSFYRGRGVGRFAFAFAVTAALCLTTIGVVLWINGEWPSRVPPMWTQPSWQPWYPSFADSFWQGPYGQGIGWAYRIPVFIVYLAFVLATLFWPSPKNLAHVLALSAAHLIGIQFWYPEQGGIYVLWYLPFLLLLMFRPNLSMCQPPLLSSEDWLARLGRWLRSRLRKVLHLAEPAHVG